MLANGEESYTGEYEAANEHYQQIEDIDLSIIEGEHIRLLDMYRSVVLGVGKTEHWDTVREMKLHYNEGTITEWLSFKRETLPACVNALVEVREWDWE